MSLLLLLLLAAPPLPGPLARLAGDWDGHAPVTPAGPLDYDITFAAKGDGLRGTAHLGGGVEHHWRFLRRDGRPLLRFMSTFGGSREWIALPAAKVEPERVVFVREEGTPLQVTVRETLSGVRFEIRLRGEEHVVIELKPSSEPKP